MASAPELILASASVARAEMLRAAGVEFIIEPASIDETSIKREHRVAGKGPSACAMALAEAKARVVAEQHGEGALVIGADQILVAGDEWYDKPDDLVQAAAQLRRLRGREHILVTATCVMRGVSRLWQSVATPKLTMRWFGESFLAGYIEAEGDALLGSVGAYRLEGRGVQLFSRVEGDHFAILGLPLLELLEFLRGLGFVGE
jgi:septum formation protein